MLQVIFGDDEHTGADGPYARLLKTRKWLYLGSIAAFAVSHNLYDETAARNALKVVQLPSSFLEAGILFGLVYLALHYLLLIWQLVTTYDLILDERFASRRAEEMASARDRLREARKAHQKSIEAYEQRESVVLEALKSKLMGELLKLNEKRVLNKKRLGELIQKNNDSHEALTLRHEVLRSNAIIALQNERLNEIEKDPSTAFSRLDPHHDADVESAWEVVRAAESDLGNLRRQEPSQRFAYRTIEQVIDFSRIATPITICGFAIRSLLA